MSETDRPDEVVRVRYRGLTIFRVPRSRVDFTKSPDPTPTELRLFHPASTAAHGPADDRPF